MLKIKHIMMTFNEGTLDEKLALKSINIQLKEVEFVTVIGGNGAGKSTLMIVMSGISILEVGDVLFNEQLVHELPAFNRSQFIGRVFQDPMFGIAPEMTIEENLAIAYSRNKKRSLRPGVTKKRREIFRGYLKTLNLGL